MTHSYGSLFAGVGGFDLGLDAAGYDCRFQVEWDKHCRQVLLRHWPTVPKWDDVRHVNGAELPPVDLLTFGSPCQDLSVAGKRAGLAGERSGLFHEAMRIIREMRDATGNQYPRIVVWENVVGALSCNAGKDFGTVITEMAETGALVVEWAVLDAQHFGVPQRRRRVFVVAVFDSATAAGCPDPLLPVSESVRGDSAKGRKKGQATSGEVGGGTPVGDDELMSSLCATDATKWGSNQWVNEGKAIVEPIGIQGNMIDRADHNGPAGRGYTVDGDPMFTLTSTDVHAVTQCSAVRRLTPVECERLMGWPDDHTRWTADGKEQADTHRYRQCGNGVASPVAQWIGKQLASVL